MKTNPPLKAIRTFESAARLLNFKEASLELNVTASAVSHQIKLLETYLGTALFIRKDRKVSLTASGVSYLQEVSRALDILDTATERIMHQESTNILKISAAPIFVTRWLMPRLQRFYEAYPDIELNIHPTSQRMNPANTDLDLLIRYAHSIQSDKQTESVHLFDEHHLTPVGCRSITDYWNRHTRLPAGTPLMEDTMSSGHQWQHWFEQFPSPGVLESHAVIRYDNQAQIFEPAIAGHGIALALVEMIQEDLEKQILFRLFPEKQITSSLRTTAIFRKHSGKKNIIKTFIEWMLSERTKDEYKP